MVLFITAFLACVPSTIFPSLKINGIILLSLFSLYNKFESLKTISLDLGRTNSRSCSSATILIVPVIAFCSKAEKNSAVIKAFG